jgi:ATP-dependent DNA helicase PIF1
MNLHEKQPISLSDEFQEVLNQLEHTSENYFVTGRAGTGKSTLLQVFRNTSKKRIAVLAPTGIAALNVKGQTLHSFFGFPPRMIDKSDIFKRKDYKFFKKIETIIIDEVSMVRADMLDNIDWFLRLHRENDVPFGGVQMIFFGDLFQLPPVIASEFEKKYFKENYSSQYFFSSKIIEEIDINMVELNQVYRQDERHFIRLLDNIRQNSIDYDDLEDLNQRFEPLPEDKKFIVYLCARNATTDAINKEEIDKLTEERFVFNAKTDGEFNPLLFPAESTLVLKVGAQIMFVKNDPQKQFVNGTIGTISHISHDQITADILDENGVETTIKVEKQTWENIKYKSDPTNETTIKAEVTGTYTQYPVKLAWAITIHKSQGKTFERVIIDLGGGAFESGQTYVALSRCKKLNGIYLKKPITPRDIFIDPVVVSFYETMKRR